MRCTVLLSLMAPRVCTLVLLTLFTLVIVAMIMLAPSDIVLRVLQADIP